MLQLLLTILAITMASVMGYTLITQLELQNAAQDMRENSRRLDVASDALTARLGRLPNIDNLLAPAPNTTFGWATLPQSVSGVNSTVGGIRFLYCPIGYSGADDSMPGNGSLTVTMGPSASYATRVRGGYVTNSNLAVDSSLTGQRPVAILVAAGRRGSTPPRCDQVRMVNGRPVVEGGLARVISDHRDGNAAIGAGESMGVEFFVTNGGSGNGLSPSSPTSLDAALRHYVSYRPSSMSITVAGPVSVAGDTWASFVTASRESELRLRLYGVALSGGGTASITTTGSSPWYLPADTSIQSVSIANARLVVGDGDRLRISGNVEIAPGSASNAVEVLEGGDMKLSQAAVSITGNVDRLIFNLGSVSIESSSLVNNGSVSTLVELGQDSSLSMSSANVGSNGARPGIAAIVDQGARNIIGASSFLAASGSNTCWSPLTADDVGLKWSANAAGQSSQVVSESNYVAPGPGATLEQIEQYDRELGERRRARLINSSIYQCV